MSARHDTAGAATTRRMSDTQRQPAAAAPVVVEDNIRALVERRRQLAAERSVRDRIADAVTAFTGSITFVVLHLIAFGAWALINAGLTPLPRFDPTFVLLATWASVEAIFLSTFVLITQNRMAREADRNAQLDLQISLLTEVELTRALRLLTAIAARLGIKEAHDPDTAELANEVDPRVVLDAIERHTDD
ncbi:MAG: DUF1003 domain-containing protein [Candidatus Binatia bacterium]